MSKAFVYIMDFATSLLSLVYTRALVDFIVLSFVLLCAQGRTYQF